jgi:hypothetical protein
MPDSCRTYHSITLLVPFQRPRGPRFVARAAEVIVTLILSYQRGSSLVMLGDMLISTESERTTAIDIPTRFSPNFPLTNLQLYGLLQKVFCINSDFAVAWAGDCLAARVIIQELARKLPRPTSGAQIIEFIKSIGLSEQELNSVAFIFWAITNRDPFQIQVQDWLVKEAIIGPDSPHHKFKFAGRGEFHFFETIEFNLLGPFVDDVGHAVGTVLTRAAMALYDELLTDTAHNFLYGGGFEIVILASVKGFEKLPLTFALWVWDDNGVELVGPVFTHQYDSNGVLGLRRFLRTTSGKWQQTIYYVGNFLSNPAAATLDINAPLGANWTVHWFIHRTEEYGLLMIHKWGDNPSIGLRFSEGAIVPVLQDEFQAEFADLVQWRKSARRVQ